MMPFHEQYQNKRLSRLIQALSGFVLIWIIGTSQFALAEGTKEIRPTVDDYGFLILDGQWSNFAFYDCPEENRLQITICKPNEKIFFGFNQTDHDVEFQLKDQDGNIVFGPQLVPNSGKGFIPSYNQAIAGPQQIIGGSGYDALSYTATTPGDYYIEFRRPSSRRDFEYFDITVASSSNKAIPGRVWSKAWMFSTRSFTTQFQGKLFIYADDGIVTSLDFNGMQPYVFVVSANKSGTGNTGNTVLDRQSKSGNVTYPQYKIFLNDPDPSSDCFPTGVFGKLTKPTTITGCGLNRCINIFVDKPGNIEVILDLNGVAGYQPSTEDRIISATVSIGANCVAWDSKDGKGNIVAPGKSIPMEVNYFNGLTHLPLYDVEAQNKGYIVELVRPNGPKPQLFWDDSKIKPANPEKVNLTGCSNPSGCHTWVWAGSDNVNTDYGNTNTINTWWYANVIKTSATFSVGNVSVDANTTKPASLGNDTTVCSTVSGIQLFGGITGTPSGKWLGGTGTFTPGRDALDAVYTPTNEEKTLGKVKLILSSDAVGACPPVLDSLQIMLTPAPVANAGIDQTVCSNVNTIILDGSVTVATGGVWSGGSGKFAPDSTALKGIYAPSASEKTGSITLTLTTTGNGICSPVSDDMKITFTNGPSANAGKDTTMCSVNPTISLDGTVTVANGGKWSGGNGTFTPNASTLKTSYKPTNAEINAGTLTLTLTTSDNGTCNSATDQVKITFSGSTTVDAGSDKSVCANAKIMLNGSVTGATGGIWSGGAGTFIPDANALNASYIPDKSEVDAGKLKLFLTSGSDACIEVKDTINIDFTPAPTIDAGPDMSSCANNPSVQLNGIVSGATGVLWTSDGNGTFVPNASTLNATYTPSAEEITAKVASLQISSTGNGGCVAVKDIMLIAINPAPTADAGPDQTVCSNNPVVVLNAQATNTPSSKLWSGGNGSFSPSATLDNPTYTASNTEVSAGAVVLTYTVNKTGCNPVSDNVQISFSPTPTAEAGAAQSVCLNNPEVALNGSFAIATTATWTGGKGKFVPNANTLNATYTPDPSEISAGSFKLFLLTSGNLNCKPVKDSVTFTITPSPEISAGPDQKVCSNNAQINLNGKVLSIATGGIWTGGNGIFSVNANDLNAKYTPTTTEIEAGNIILTLTSTGNGNCLAVSDQVRIDFSPIPQANAGADITVCADNPAANLNGSFTLGATGIWSGGNGSFTPDATSLKAVYHPSLDEISAGTATLILTSVSNGTYGSCSSVFDNVSINILPAPTVDAGADQTACGNIASLALSGMVTTATGSTWTTSGTGTFFPNASTINASYRPSTQDKDKGMIILNLKSTGNGLCSAVSNDLKITFTSIPKIEAGPDQKICTNDFPIKLKGSGSAGNWINGTGNFTPGRNILNASYTPAAADISAGFVKLIAATTGTLTCPSVSDTVQISFIDGPKTFAGNNASICGNQAIYKLNGSINNGFKVIWTTSGTGSFSPNANDLNANYSVSATDKKIGFVDFTLISIDNGLCNADSTQLRLSILPEPVVNAGPAEKICADANSIQLKGTVTNASGALWSTSGNGSFAPSTSDLNATYKPSNSDVLLGTVTLSLTSANDGICTPASDAKLITIAPAPKVSAGADMVICGDSSYVILSGSVTIATGGKWTTSGTGTFSPNEYDLKAKYFPSAADIAASQINLVLTSEGNGNCNPVKDTVKLTITPIPTVDPGMAQLICADAPNIVLNGSVKTATGGKWTTSGTGTFVPNDSLLNAVYKPSLADTAAHKVRLTLTAGRIGNCIPKTAFIDVTIKPTPIANAGNDQVVCADTSGVTLQGYIVNATGNVWSSNGTGKFFPNTSASKVKYVPSPQDIQVGNVKFKITSTGNGTCLAVNDEALLRITPAPTVVVSNDTLVCSDVINLPVSAKITTATGGFWKASGSGKFLPDSSFSNAQYIPSVGDKGVGMVLLNFTTTGNGICKAVKDQLKITINPAPIVNSGPDVSICSYENNVDLRGTVKNAQGGIWSTSGTGFFSPENTTLSTHYILTTADKNAGMVNMIFTSTGNGFCSAKSDTMKVVIISEPKAFTGEDKIICATTNSILLNGKVQNAGGGTWVTSGTGYFSPNETSLNATYVLSLADKASSSFRLTLYTTGNGNCMQANDQIMVQVTPAPTADAGTDQTICADREFLVLNGIMTNAQKGSWSSSGNGFFSPGKDTSHTNYIPSKSDKLNGKVVLTFTSNGNGICTAAKDQMQLTIVPAPTLEAGPNQTLCPDVSSIEINPMVTIATGGVWTSSGTGTFDPGPNNILLKYIPTPEDITAGSIKFSIVTTGNGSCNALYDSVRISFTGVPKVNAGNDKTVCSNSLPIQLEGSGTSGTWSGFTGTIQPTSNTLNAVYAPSPAEVSAGFVELFLTSSTTGSCAPSKDTVIISIKTGPEALAGNDQDVCADISTIALLGAVKQASGGSWTTSGTGTFSLDTDLNATYSPSDDDKIGGTVTLTLNTIDNNGCEPDKDDLLIRIIPAPFINAGLDRIVCADAGGINIQGIRTNATNSLWTSLPSGGSFDNGAALDTKYNPSANDISSGLVKLILQTIGNVGCPDVSDTLQLVITPIVTVNAGDDQILCADAEEINLTGTKTIAGGITWASSGQGYFTPDIHALQAKYVPQGNDTAVGTVNIFINTIDNGTCKPAGDAMQIKFTPAPRINAGEDQTICSDVPTVKLNGKVEVASGLIWKSSGSGKFNSSDTLADPIYTISNEDKNAEAVLLSLTSTGNGNCKPVVDYVAINILPVPAAMVNAGFDQTLCANTKSVQLNGIVRGAGGGIWKSTGNGVFRPNSISLDAQYIPTAQDTANKSIKIILTTTNNGICNAVTDTLTITFTPAPSALAGIPQTICADSAYVQLNGKISNAGGGIWISSGTGFFTPSADALLAKYIPSAADLVSGKIGLTLTTTSNGICEAANSGVALNITPTPTVEAGPDTAICSGSAVINLRGSRTVAKGVLWSSSGSGTFSPDEFSMISSYEASQEDIEEGTVIIQIRSTVNGTCKPVLDQLKLTILSSPQVSAGPDQTICAGSTGVSLKGAVKIATSGVWKTSGSGKFIPSNTSLVTTYIPSTEDEINKTVTLVLSSSGMNNCNIVTDTVVVTILPKPLVNTGNAVVCDFNNGAQLNATIQFAGGGIWSSSGTGTFSPDAFSLNGKYIPSAEDILNKSAILTLTSTENTVCSAVSSQTIVSILPPPLADAGKDKFICRGNNTNLVAIPVTGVMYHWETSDGTKISDNEYVNIIAFSDTSFTLKATDERGCPASDQINIGVIDPPTFGLQDQFCLNDTLMVDSKPQNLPLVNGLFQWSVNASNLFGETKSIIYPEEAGKYKIIYSYSSCSALDTTVIYDSPQLISFDKFACEGDLTELKTADLQHVTYTWTLANQIIGSKNPLNIVVPVDTNFYRVQATDTLTGCVSNIASRIIGLPKPIINLNDLSACSGDTIYLQARPLNINSINSLKTSYAWKKDNSTLSLTNDSIPVITGGIYSVTVKVEVCTAFDTAKVNYNPIPLKIPVHETEFCSESDPFVILTAGKEQGVTYLWQPSGKTGAQDTIRNAGTYSVTITNQYNCVTKDSILVKDLCPPRLFVPNAFIPGGNEPFFKVFGKDFTNFKITVFSRWGEIVYYSENEKGTWDGKYRGADMPIGVYPYIITYEGEAKGKKGPYRVEGSITIIR